MAKAKQDIYKVITERVIDGLKTKGLNWFKPWNAGTGDLQSILPINNTTGRAYKGFNVFWLSCEMEANGYQHNEWLTYKQAEKIGGQVRKGSKGTQVVYWNICFVDENGKFYRNAEAVKKAGISLGDVKKIFSPRLHTVFNIGQCDNVEPRRKPQAPVKPSEFNPLEMAESVYRDLYPKDKRPALDHGGDRAYYSPVMHKVQMPKPDTFKGADYYYHTLFHELIHSTGHKDILNRLSDVAAFGTKDYSKEELVAEIGAQFLSGIMGVQCNQVNSQAYINGWITKLSNNPKWVIGASTHAQKAVEFILGEAQ